MRSHRLILGAALLVGCGTDGTGPEPVTPKPTATAVATTATATASATATATASATATQDADAPEGMVSIPAGPFDMGVDDEARKSSGPVHEIDLSAFYIDRTEVTVDAYRKCVDAHRCPKPGTGAPNCNWHKKNDRGSHPINCIKWDQARKYCAWAGKRLPTEAEWEKAARGTDGRAYPWGNSPPANCRRAVMGDCPGNDTHPVDSMPAGKGPYGTVDMAGNVWEWVADWYADDYYQKSPKRNPTGPKRGTERVLRGGSFSAGNAWNMHAANRFYAEPVFDMAFFGFRCAQTAK